MIASLALLLSFALAVAAQAPPQPTFPACTTLAQIEVTPNAPPFTVVSSIDTTPAGIASRSDLLQPVGKDFQLLTALMPAGKGVAFFVTNYLNMSSSCISITMPPSPAPVLPQLTFVGVDSLSGVKANHWRQPNSNVTVELWTAAANNDQFLYLLSGNSRSTFSHQVDCQSGSLDPSLFLPPAGLACPLVRAWPSTRVAKALETMAMLTRK